MILTATVQYPAVTAAAADRGRDAVDNFTDKSVRIHLIPLKFRCVTKIAECRKESQGQMQTIHLEMRKKIMWLMKYCCKPVQFASFGAVPVY